MVTLTKDMLERIENNYQYDQENYEEIADENHYKFLSVELLKDYRFMYTYKNEVLDIKARWNVKAHGEKFAQIALESDFRFKGRDVNLIVTLNDEEFNETKELTEDMAKSLIEEMISQEECDSLDDKEKVLWPFEPLNF